MIAVNVVGSVLTREEMAGSYRAQGTSENGTGMFHRFRLSFLSV